MKIEQIARLTKWRLAFESLTPQGSEFYNDLDNCMGYVRQRLDEGHEAKKQNVKLRREIARLTSEVEAAKRAVRYALATTRTLSNYIFDDSDFGLLLAEMTKKLEDVELEPFAALEAQTADTGESRAEFEADRFGQTGYDLAKGEKL